jgi:dehydrogenase/reductase SDR family protein 7B
MIIKGKVVWITGASSGIGKELAIGYAKEGATVILTSRNKEKLEAVGAICRKWGVVVFVATLDLENYSSIKSCVTEVINHFPKIDILINNGGISQRSLSIETPIEVDRKIMETNFFGAITLTKELLPALVKDNGGHIVVISSVTGKFGFPLRTAYSASKHALQGYFEALRAELYDKNIKITIVSPGRIVTDISLNSITKNGTKYGIMDEGQAGGMPADICARKIISAVSSNRKELLVGSKETLLVYIRKYCPPLFHLLARKVKPT